MRPATDRKPLIGIAGILLLVGLVLQQLAWDDERDQGAPTGRPYTPTMYDGNSNN